MSETDVSSSDVFESDVSNRIRVYLDGLNIDDIEVGELCDSDDSRRLDSAHKSDSNGQNWPEFNPENDMSNLRLKVGMLFKSKDSLKEASKQYVRRIVGLDGYFLKGYYGGYLLATVGIDATNDIYPIAYTVVESENQASWLWFLELLTIDLEILSSYEISFMYDKQKSKHSKRF
ncbi:hypothetical protein Goklo_013444 [Gossypium klotzschianum]|uniref:MULE transposase domain-containing protein n=1 Tax=Gossypium klotzschianum TaxID=34286 RepID=A0A7J8U4N0_9ROSI|nr:hypothetical protein [Gossypium klotzschianum]